MSWAISNKGQILAALAVLIAGFSALIKGLEMLVAVLVMLVPSLKTADGELKSAAAWLDKFSKSSFLNTVALSPKMAKKLLLVFALGLGIHTSTAQAQILVSSGPTVPLMEFRPGNPHPVNLAAGAGYQLSLTLPQLQRAIGGRAWDIVDLQLMAFGSAVSNASGNSFSAASVAAGFSFLSSLLFLGIGHDVITGPGLTNGWFGLFALSVNFDSAPQSPPAGTSHATLGMTRGNTLYFGAP